MPHITLKEVERVVAEVAHLNEAADQLNWDTQRPEVDAIYAEIERKQALIQERIDELRHHDVIKTLEYASDYGFSPVTALSNWVSSWC
jgi:demethoxyubiquinone hydroxylase (CLK1/Coq7/Cat5 family)